MRSEILMVEMFHQAFGAPVGDEPNIPPEDRLKLRAKLILEEVFEFIKAAGLEVFCGQDTEQDPFLDFDMLEIKCNRPARPNFLEMCDALKDIQVVVHGTEIEMGIQHKAEGMFNEVMLSNMSKLGEDGKPIKRGDGKILKGPNYFKPNLAKFFQEIPQ